MKMLEQLGVFGWPLEDENLILASLLTGDPLLLIGPHGSAKTQIARKMAEALNKAFMAYDASKALFEDVLGFPNVESLKAGKVEYVPSAVTVWDKEFVLVDEINRALPELQSKWLEIVRSRCIMGFPTDVKWVWAAMNPSDDSAYSGTRMLDAALVGRFATFLYPPEVLSMNEDDRIRVIRHINGDDAPALSQWGEADKTVTISEVKRTGRKIALLLRVAAKHFHGLRQSLDTLGEFMSRFAVLVLKETDNKVKLDGRRLGFLHRNLLAVRAVELARAEQTGEQVRTLAESARTAILAGIPLGIAADGINREESLHKVEICFNLLVEYFEKESNLSYAETVYRLFTTNDLLEKARILVTEDLSELVKSKAWNDIVGSTEDRTSLAYIALQVEARQPGTIPLELMEGLGRKVDLSHLSTKSIPCLQGESVEYIEEVEALLNKESGLDKILAYEQVRGAVQAGLTKKSVEELTQRIETNIKQFRKILDGLS